MSILASLPNQNNALKEKQEVQGTKCVNFCVMLLIHSVRLIYIFFLSSWSRIFISSSTERKITLYIDVKNDLLAYFPMYKVKNFTQRGALYCTYCWL